AAPENRCGSAIALGAREHAGYGCLACYADRVIQARSRLLWHGVKHRWDSGANHLSNGELDALETRKMFLQMSQLAIESPSCSADGYTSRRSYFQALQTASQNVGNISPPVRQFA